MTPNILSALLPATTLPRGAGAARGADAAAEPADFAASLDLMLRALAGEAPALAAAEAGPDDGGAERDEPAAAGGPQPDALALLLAGVTLAEAAAPPPAAPTVRPDADAMSAAPAGSPALAPRPLEAAAAAGAWRAVPADPQSPSTTPEAFTHEVVAARAAGAPGAPGAPGVPGAPLAGPAVAVAPAGVAAGGRAAALAPAAGPAGAADVRDPARALAAAGAAPQRAAALQPEVAPPADALAAPPSDLPPRPVQPAALAAMRGFHEHKAEGQGDLAPAAPAVLPAGAAAAAPTPGPAPAQGAPATAQLPVPVGSSEWGPALARQLVRLGPNRELELQLHPAELGPLKVKLSLGERQAQVMFVSEHAAVRQALEAALPQLRSTFADSGISLGQATVGSGAGDSAAQQGAGQQAAARREREPQPEARAAERLERGDQRARSNGGSGLAVDTFA
ncbi:flagellar hook-length control protein FliK [Ramlibacter sp.]|uniref:flagellar hook-length control protein FliK n=1 Tax=Ramlibacter sp. TaxID=1917967 RepID=UPI002C86A2D1|nr:flagellar hook-length control protein FliK [Ramlibacter sp.]HWI83379.1 flagellar hook-length control protein FliK [Ramlibacter sp.]